jgi:hypothetical protein
VVRGKNHCSEEGTPSLKPDDRPNPKTQKYDSKYFQQSALSRVYHLGLLLIKEEDLQKAHKLIIPNRILPSAQVLAKINDVSQGKINDERRTKCDERGVYER